MCVAHMLLALWSLFVLFPLYWVVITSFKDAAAVNLGPFYIPFLDFQPTLDAWRTQFNIEPNCDLPAIVRQLGLLFHNTFAFIVSPVVTLQPMEPQICKIYHAFTNSFVVSLSRRPSASPSAPWRPTRWPASSTSPSSATS